MKGRYSILSLGVKTAAGKCVTHLHSGLLRYKSQGVDIATGQITRGLRLIAALLRFRFSACSRVGKLVWQLLGRFIDCKTFCPGSCWDRLEIDTGLIQKIETLNNIPVRCGAGARDIVFLFFDHEMRKCSELTLVCHIPIHLANVMTEGPPPSQASGSGTVSADSGQTTLPIHSNPTLPGTQPLSYESYSSWNNAWSSNYSGYAGMTAHPALYGHMHPYTNLMPGYGPHMMTTRSNSYNPYSHLASKIDKVNSEQSTTSTKISHSTPVSSTSVSVATPSLSEVEGCRHWDEVLRRFLEKTKMTQCLKGFEIDMLVLNSEWEQEIVLGALKELVNEMQVCVRCIMQNVSKRPTTLFSLFWIVLRERLSRRKKFRKAQLRPVLSFKNSDSLMNVNLTTFVSVMGLSPDRHPQ